VIPQHPVVAGAWELGEVQRLAVERDLAPEARREGLAQAAVDHGKARKVTVFVEDEKDPRPRFRNVRPDGQDGKQQGQREQRAPDVTSRPA
jgi:hypothetical protein